MTPEQGWAKFQALCGQHLIDPNIALEDENIQQAIRSRDWTLIEDLLLNEF